jgi:hypothetical protein
VHHLTAVPDGTTVQWTQDPDRAAVVIVAFVAGLIMWALIGWLLITIDRRPDLW